MQKRRRRRAGSPTIMPEALQEERPECGALFQEDGRVRWRVWAPKAKRVELVLIDGESRPSARWNRNSRATLASRAIGFSAVSAMPIVWMEALERPDPASRWQPDGVNRPSAVLHWDDILGRMRLGAASRVKLSPFMSCTSARLRPKARSMRSSRGCRRCASWASRRSKLCRWRNFPARATGDMTACIPMRRNTVTAGRTGLQRLVDACHRHGLAVFLDVVYNHFGPEGNYLAEFGPYFTEQLSDALGSGGQL